MPQGPSSEPPHEAPPSGNRLRSGPILLQKIDEHKKALVLFGRILVVLGGLFGFTSALYVASHVNDTKELTRAEQNSSYTSQAIQQGAINNVNTGAVNEPIREGTAGNPIAMQSTGIPADRLADDGPPGNNIVQLGSSSWTVGGGGNGAPNQNLLNGSNGGGLNNSTGGGLSDTIAGEITLNNSGISGLSNPSGQTGFSVNPRSGSTNPVGGVPGGAPHPNSLPFPVSGNAFIIPSEILGDLPLIFFLSLSLFAVANILLFRSGSLLKAIVSIREDLHLQTTRTLVQSEEGSGVPEKPSSVALAPPLFNEGKHIGDFRSQDVAWVIGFYIVFIIVMIINRSLKLGLSYPMNGHDVARSLLTSIFLSPDLIAPVFFILAIAPASIAMINFILFSSLSSRLQSAPESPSPIIGIFGALLSLVSLLGSLAGIAKLFLDHSIK